MVGSIVAERSILPVLRFFLRAAPRNAPGRQPIRHANRTTRPLVTRDAGALVRLCGIGAQRRIEQVRQRWLLTAWLRVERGCPCTPAVAAATTGAGGMRPPARSVKRECAGRCLRWRRTAKKAHRSGAACVPPRLTPPAARACLAAQLPMPTPLQARACLAAQLAGMRGNACASRAAPGLPATPRFVACACGMDQRRP